MRRLFWAAVVYTVLGLAGGLYYRELTKAKHFTGDTELSVVHTHFLTLGMMIFLILMIFERVFSLSSARGYSAFFWTYNVGLLWTVVMMIVIGTREVYGHRPGDAISGIAGVGHIIITVALIIFFHTLYRAAVRPRSDAAAQPVPPPTAG